MNMNKIEAYLADREERMTHIVNRYCGLVAMWGDSARELEEQLQDVDVALSQEHGFCLTQWA